MRTCGACILRHTGASGRRGEHRGPGGEGSYPIVAVVFGLASDRSAQRPQTARAFLEWSVTRSRATAEQLGYVALPPSAVQKVQAVLR